MTSKIYIFSILLSFSTFCCGQSNPNFGSLLIKVENLTSLTFAQKVDSTLRHRPEILLTRADYRLGMIYIWFDPQLTTVNQILFLLTQLSCNINCHVEGTEENRFPIKEYREHCN